MAKSGYDYEIIVVDDAPEDKTAEIVKFKDTKVIRHAFNRGMGASIKIGARSQEF